MKKIILTEEQHELLMAALDSSPVVEGANGEPDHPAAVLWHACARAETVEGPEVAAITA